MKKLACRYAIVQFLPYPETGEFANVGIVLLCADAGFFGFKLQERRYSRITQFFEEFDGQVYRRAVALLKQELERIQAVLRVGAFGSSPDPDGARDVFTALVHPREAILRFGQPRALLAESPEAAVEQLFGYYVERDFVTPEYQETVLEKRVKTLLSGLHLPHPFRPMDIGNNEVHARFPLVQAEGERPMKAIKPFFLAQDESNKILHHGGLWIEKVKRLRKRNLLPDEVLFAVQAPEEKDTGLFAAYREICDDLEGYQVTVVAAAQEQRIVDFARA